MIKLTALTIKTRIVLAATVVFGIALIGFAIVIYHSSRRAELEKLEARLESHSEKLQTEIEEQCQDKTFPNLIDLNAIQTEGLSHVVWQLFDTTGRLVLPKSAFLQVPESLSNPGVLRESILRRISINGRRYLGLWAPVEIVERVQFTLLLAAPLHEVDENLDGLLWTLWTTIPAALLLTGLAIFLIVRRALHPLTAMTETAQRISATNLGQRLELPPAQDEVRVFAETLNHMIERIEVAFHGQKQFVADASHEIRTPLTVLNSELEYALKLATAPGVRASIEASLLEIDRLSHMVEGLLMLTRVDASQVAVEGRRCRLDEIMLDVIQSMRLLADKKKVTITPYLQDAVELSGDGEMVRRAILNVLDNALKYSPPNSNVSVSLEIPSRESVSIVIRDQGPGISEADQERIFKRFFRGEIARAETEGSGLGLAIAKKLIELNRGTISVRSALGQGTSVTIHLPQSGTH